MLTSERTVNHSVTIKLTSAESETKASILFNCEHFQGVDKKSWLVLCQIALWEGIRVLIVKEAILVYPKRWNCGHIDVSKNPVGNELFLS